IHRTSHTVDLTGHFCGLRSHLLRRHARTLRRLTQQQDLGQTRSQVVVQVASDPPSLEFHALSSLELLEPAAQSGAGGSPYGGGARGEDAQRQGGLYASLFPKARHDFEGYRLAALT